MQTLASPLTVADRRPAPLWPLALFVGAFCLMTLLLLPQAYPQVALTYLMLGVQKGLLLVVPALLVMGLIMRPAAPTRFVVETVKARWLSALLVMTVFLVATAAFTSIKLSIPLFNPFYADALFDQIDRALHGGAPWRLTHAVVGGWLEYPFGYAYGVGWFAGWFGIMVFVAFWDGGQARVRYLWAHALTVVIVGALLATLLSSYGPIFYDRFGTSHGYDDLLARLDASPVGSQIRGLSSFLFATTMSKDVAIGSGISAMPSMHVAIASLNACLLWSLNRWLGIVGWVFAGMILIGSVHFGWHYAIDGYVSLIVVALIWQGTGLVARRRARAKAVRPGV